MSSSISKDNYSLLNEEKKAQIMQNLREEIDKQKSHYSMSEDQINNIQNKNIYNSNDIKNLNLNNSDNINDTEKDDDDDEEHMEILNNAKNVLNQIQDDINKFTKTYGIQNIMPKQDDNLSNKLKDNNINDIDDDNESNESESNIEEEKNNNVYFNNDDGNNDDNFNNENNEDEFNNENNEDDFNNENNEDNLNNENYEDNYDYINNEYEDNNDDKINYMEEIENSQNQYDDDYNNNNNQDKNEINYNNRIILNQNKNASIKFNEYNNYINNQNNTLYQKEEEKKNKINQSDYNKINYSKYNFDNPLGYDNEFMKNNIKNNYNYGIKKEMNKKINKNNNYNYNPDNGNKKIIKKKKSNNIKKFNLSTDNIFAAKNREKFQSMKKELEDKFAQDHPFKPKINKNYQKTNMISETEQERYNRLSRPKILDINEKRRIKDLEELKKISENNILKPSHKVNPKDVSNRLYKLSQELKIKKDKIKQTYEETHNKEYSFTPEINAYSKILMDKYEQKPIYERNEDFEKQKTNNIIKIRQEIEKEQKERCKPKINSKSRKIAQMQRNNGEYEEYEDVYERLYRENINKDTKNLGTRDMKECTFAPKVNPISNLLVSNNGQNYNNNLDDYEGYNENMKDFLERQKMYEDLKKKKLEKNQKNNKDYTFKPEINSNSDLLVKCNPERLGEKNLDKYSRLYQDAQRIKQKKEKLENELNSKYDYTPKINELSKYIGRKPGIDELNLIPEKANKNQKEEEEYDFTPQINQNSKYKNIQSNYKNDQGILGRINEEVQNKNKKIETLQKMKENDDISKYNFIPEINKEMPDFENNKPMYMKGMARYLNQMEKARQAKRDKEQREKEVFLTGEGWNKNNGITVPKPFKLSYQNNNKKDCFREKDRQKEENKECQFKMKNNESKNREIIKKLLNGN